MIAVAVSDLSVTYGEVVALTGVSLTVPQGRVVGLIGMNGSGKSTLFKAIMGLVRPAAGHVVILGNPPAVARRDALVAYVPQSEDIDWDFPLSVRDVVMMGRYGHQGRTRRPRPVDREAVERALARVDLTELGDRQIGQLSGGQKKRVFVARGLAQEAQIMLLDEPFAGVDKASEALIVRVLRDVASEGGAVLVSTHDLHALPDLADEAVLLNRCVIAHGDVAHVLEPQTLARAFNLDAAEVIP